MILPDEELAAVLDRDVISALQRAVQLRPHLAHSDAVRHHDVTCPEIKVNKQVNDSSLVSFNAPRLTLLDHHFKIC